MGRVGVAWCLVATAVVVTPIAFGIRWLRAVQVNLRDDVDGLAEWASVVEGDDSWQERRAPAAAIPA